DGRTGQTFAARASIHSATRYDGIFSEDRSLGGVIRAVAELKVPFASRFQLINAAFRCARVKRYPERVPRISQKTNITPRVRVTKARSRRARECSGVSGAGSGTKRRNTTPGRTRNKNPESLANPDR